MSRDVIITPANGVVDFLNSSSSKAQITLTTANNLIIANPNGDISIGNTASNLYVGDGVNSVDIIFEQNGAIRALTGKTLTLGQSDSSIRVASPITLSQVDVNGAIAITNTSGSIIVAQYGNIFTTSAVTSYTVDTFPTATYRSAKYFAQQTSGSTYGVIELNLVHNGSTVYLTQYGENKSNASANLGVFDAAISSGNLNLTYTPGSVYTAQTLKIFRAAIPV
jgi:hypothetical protein